MGSIGAISADDRFNTRGELKAGKTVVYQTKRGTQYYVMNDYGAHLVWKRKYVEGSGGGTGKWVDQYIRPTTEIKNNVRLER